MACIELIRPIGSTPNDKKKSQSMYTHLRRKGRKYRKRGSSKDSKGIIVGRVSIDQRPDIVEKRSGFGDLEVDMIIGKNHKQAIVTLNDRASGMLKMKKVPSREANIVATTINEMPDEWMPFTYTITSDNGKEFADHKRIAETLEIDYYFAHPYHSWERDSNENLNGLIRQYFPKKTDFTQITDKEIQNVETKLNNRPRKRFKYQTPVFVMNQLFFNQNVAFVT